MKFAAMGLKRKHEEMRSKAGERARVAVGHIARNAGLFIIANSPRDTNRFARAWAIAMNEAKLGPAVPVLKTRKGQFIENARVEERIADDLRRWRRRLGPLNEARVYWHGIFENRYQRIGRKGRWRDDAMRRMKAAEKKVAKAQEIIRRLEDALAMVRDSGGNAIVIFGKKKAASKAGLILGIQGVDTGDLFDADREKFQKRVEKTAFALSQLHRVIVKTHGGKAEWVQMGDKVIVRLINLEAHAKIVDKKHRLVQRSMAVARRNRKKIVTEAFVRKSRRAAAAAGK